MQSSATSGAILEPPKPVMHSSGDFDIVNFKKKNDIISFQTMISEINN
jgi:hypothetical protein